MNSRAEAAFDWFHFEDPRRRIAYQNAKVQRELRATELKANYPRTESWLGELIAKIEANDRQIDYINRHALPRGVRFEVRNLSRGVESWRMNSAEVARITKELCLPSCLRGRWHLGQVDHDRRFDAFMGHPLKSNNRFAISASCGSTGRSLKPNPFPRTSINIVKVARRPYSLSFAGIKYHGAHFAEVLANIRLQVPRAHQNRTTLIDIAETSSPTTGNAWNNARNAALVARIGESTFLPLDHLLMSGRRKILRVALALIRPRSASLNPLV